MKLFVCVIFVITAFFVQDHQCLLKTWQIKITNCDPKYCSEETIQAFTDTWNDTYNYELMHWNLERDLPQDVALASEAYVIDSDGQRGELLLNITIPICEESIYRQALPKFLRVSKDKLGKTCIAKDNYYVTDVGQINLETLIPKLSSKGQYFLTVNNLISGSDNILDWVSVLESLSEKEES